MAFAACAFSCTLSHRSSPAGDAAAAEHLTDDRGKTGTDGFASDVFFDDKEPDQDVRAFVDVIDAPSEPEADAMDASDASDALDAADIHDVYAEPDVMADALEDRLPSLDADGGSEAAADVSMDVSPPPPPVLVQFQHGSDVRWFGDYWFRWRNAMGVTVDWTRRRCAGGIRSLPMEGNWSECRLDSPLGSGSWADFYPIYPDDTEVCQISGPCPAMFASRFVVVYGSRRIREPELLFQREMVGSAWRQYLHAVLP